MKNFIYTENQKEENNEHQYALCLDLSTVNILFDICYYYWPVT